MSKYKLALQEAMASVGDQVILHTLEFRHPAFIDDTGNLMAVRIVRDNANLVAPLEAAAAMNGGQWVTFIACAFDLVLPPEDSSPSPEITIRVDNVTRMLEAHLEAAANSMDTIEITYRPYLSSALADGVQMDYPYTLIVSSVSSDIMSVTATAKMADIGNKAFLWETITAERFPTLAA